MLSQQLLSARTCGVFVSEVVSMVNKCFWVCEYPDEMTDPKRILLTGR